MTCLALATDYDGTLALKGRVGAPTLDALERFKRSGRTLVMVTGREVDDLATVFDRFDLFDLIVAENGALIYHPGDRSERALGRRPPDAFLDALRSRGVAPLAVGRVVVATWEFHRKSVEEAIREFGLDLQIVMNKGSVMALPAGVDKASGLAVALGELRIAARDVVAVGDAENDLAFMAACGRSAAVANALPEVKAAADVVTIGERGAGVVELIDAILGGGGGQ